MKLHTALAQDGRAAQGELRVRDWLKQQPEDFPVRLYLAEAYLKGAKYGDAIDEYQLLLAKQPDNLVVLNNLAWCYQKVKDKRAVETAEKALKLQPENPAVIDTLGWILVESNDVARGVELLKKAAGLAPKSPEIRFHYVQALVKLGDKQSAKNELERLLVEFPKFSESANATKLLATLRAS
jgi:predicted Zn-dependent protease